MDVLVRTWSYDEVIQQREPIELHQEMFHNGKHTWGMMIQIHHLDPHAGLFMLNELDKQLDGIFGENIQSIPIDTANGKFLYFLSLILFISKCIPMFFLSFWQGR